MIARIQQAIAEAQFWEWYQRYQTIPPVYRHLPFMPYTQIRAAVYYWNTEWNRT